MILRALRSRTASALSFNSVAHTRLMASAVCAVGMTACVSAGGAYAQDDDSVLGMAWQELKDNQQFTTIVSAAYFPASNPEATDQEKEKLEGYARQQWASEAYIGDYWRLNVDLEAVASTFSGAEQGVFTVPRSTKERGRHLDVNKLTFTYLGDENDITIGKAVFATSVSETIKLANVIGNTNSAVPLIAYDQGVWQARVDHYLEEGKLHATIAPFNTSSGSPQGESRFLSASGLPSFLTGAVDTGGGAGGGGGNTSVETRTAFGPNLSPHDWQVEVGYNNTWDGWDAFFNAYHGRSPYTVVLNDTTNAANLLGATTQVTETMNPDAFILSAGTVTTKEAWKFYGEGLYVDIVDNDLDEDFLHGVIGVQYTETRTAEALGLDSIELLVEVAADKTIQPMSTVTARTGSSKESRANDMNLVTGLVFKVHSALSFGALQNSHMANEEFTQSAFVTYEYDDNTKLTLTGTRFEGGQDTNMANFEFNDNVEFRVERKF